VLALGDGVGDFFEDFLADLVVFFTLDGDDPALLGDTDLAFEAFAFFVEAFLDVVFSEVAGDGVLGPLVVRAELSALLDRDGELALAFIARVVAISRFQAQNFGN